MKRGKLSKRCTGASTIEYAVLVGFIALTALAAIPGLERGVRLSLCEAAGKDTDYNDDGVLDYADYEAHTYDQVYNQDKADINCNGLTGSEELLVMQDDTMTDEGMIWWEWFHNQNNRNDGRDPN